MEPQEVFCYDKKEDKCNRIGCGTCITSSFIYNTINL